MSSSDEDKNCTRNLKNKLGSIMRDDEDFKSNSFGQAKFSLGLKKKSEDSDDDIERDDIDRLSSSTFNSKQKTTPMHKA
jgi:hypothetical protein